MSETKNLDTALLAAQRAVEAVQKDGTNTFHNYKYASAEAIITESRRVLLDAGLVARRGGYELVPGEPAQVRIQLHLAHPESGESLTEPATWPVVPEKGRPWDKAVATALTSSWSYWLRDLLLIPRVAEEMDKRDDTAWTPPVAAAQTRPAAAPSRPNGGYGRDSGQARPGSTQAPAAAPAPTLATEAQQRAVFAGLGRLEGTPELDEVAFQGSRGPVTWAQASEAAHAEARGGRQIPLAVAKPILDALDALEQRHRPAEHRGAPARQRSGVLLGKKKEAVEDMSDESLDWWRGQLSSKLDDPRWGEKNRLDLVAVDAEIAYRAGGPNEIESGEVLPDEIEYGPDTDELSF